MQHILDLSNEFCSKLASDPASLSDFVRQSVKELTSLSKLIKPLNDYGSLLTSKKLLEAASSGESSPCYSDNDEEDLSRKTRNKTFNLYEIGQMFLDTSSTIEITQVTQDGSWYSWILLHGLQEEEHINGLQKLLDKHLKLKYENIKTLIYKGKKSLVIQCKDHFSAQKTFHFLDEDFYAKAYIKKRWPVIRFYNRMAEPKYMAQFYGIILKNLPNDCTVETITNLIKMNCPSVSCLSIEIPTKIEDTVATVIRTKNLEDAEMLALTLNDLMSENTTIQAGLHPSCSLKQENLAKGPFKEIKGGPGHNTTTGSEHNQGQTKNNVKDLLSMFKSGNKKDNKDVKNEGYQNQRPVSLDPRERENAGNSNVKSPSWLKNNQKMETEGVRVNSADKEKTQQQEDSSQILYSPTRQSPRYQNASSPGTKILYDDQMENNQKTELLMTNSQHNVQVNNPLSRQMPQEQVLPPNMHHHGPNMPNFPGQYNNMVGPGPGMPPNTFPLLEHQRPLIEDFQRQNNNMPEIYRRPFPENNIPNPNHPHFNDRVPFQPHQNFGEHGHFPHQNPYMGHNIPHQQHMFYDNNEVPIEMRNPNMNPYPQQPPREMVNLEAFTPEDTKMRPKYKRMIVKGPLYPTMAFKKKMMQNPSMQMSDKYSIPEDRKNKVSKISLKKLWQPKYISPYREMRSMNTRYLMHRLQRMAIREAPLANRLNTITGFEGPVVFRQQNQQKQPDIRQEQKVISTQVNEWKLDINTITRPLPMPQNISIADMYPPVNRMKPNAVDRESPNTRPGISRNNEGYKNNKGIGPEQEIPKNIKNFSKLPYWATRILDNRQMEENEFLQRRLIERSWQETEKPVVKPVTIPKNEPIPVQKTQNEKKIEERSMEQASQENANYIQQQLKNASDKDSSSEWKIVFNVEPPKPNPPSGLPPKKLNEKMTVNSNVTNKRELELNLNSSKPQMKPSAPSQPINRPQNTKKSQKIEEETEVRKLNNQAKKSESDKEKEVTLNPIGEKPISLEKDHLNRTGFQRLKQNLLDFQRKSNDSQNFKSWYLDSYGPHDEEEESESSSSSDDHTILPAKKKVEPKKEAEKANQSVEKKEKVPMEIESKELQLTENENLKAPEAKEQVEENSWLINYHTKPKTPTQKKMTDQPKNLKADEALKPSKKGESEKLSLKLPVKSSDKAESLQPAEKTKKTNADQSGSKVAASPQHYSPQILLNQTFSSFSAYPMPQNLVVNHSVPGADSQSKTEPEKLKDDQNKANNASKGKEQNNSNTGNTSTPSPAPIPIPNANPPNQMTFTSHISHVPAMGYVYFPTVSSTITYSSLMMNMMPPHYPQPTVISDPAGFNPQMMVYHNNMIMNPLVNTSHPTSYYMHPNIPNENKPTSKKAKNRKDLKKLMDKRPYDDVNIRSGQKRTHQSFLSETEAGASFTDNEAKSPEAYPEPEGTPPSMPIEPPSGNEPGNLGSSKRVIRDGVDCDAKNIHESL